jgi:hypothetical protein
MKRIYRTCVLSLGAAALLAAGSLNAAVPPGDKVTIPFEFRVMKTTLPAGEYRLQHRAHGFANLVNVQTGQAVQVVLSGPSGRPAKLIFQKNGEVPTLKAVE